MPRLIETVLVDGVVYPIGTDSSPELVEKIPAQFWDAPAAAEAMGKTTRPRSKSKSE